MSSKEIKDEIKRVVDSAPDNILEDVLEYLKSVLAASHENAQDIQHLRQILQEDKKLLERLAQ
jgi:hypothetical protein